MNTTTMKPARPRAARRGLRWAAAAGAALVAFVAFTAWRMTSVPAGLDYATTRLSNDGAFRASYTPSETPIPINRLHAWTLHLETPDGAPIDDADISVDGDMPQHGHGLPTQPAVTERLGHGDYLVEGVKFQMGGWWVMDFKVAAAGQTDTVRFNFILR